MKEELVSFQTAKLAKDKGFDIPSHSYYFEDGDFKEFEINDTHGYYGDEFTVSRDEFYTNWNGKWKTTKEGDRCFGCNKNPRYLETFSAPTQSLLQRFIRETRGVHIEIHRNASGYYYSMCMSDGGTDLGWSELAGPNDGNVWNSYEDALESALQLQLSFDLPESKKDLGYWSSYVQHVLNLTKHD